MDRQAVITQLEGLQEHCESMIDKDDPECIWRDDTEALAEAIKALSFDKDKNQIMGRGQGKMKDVIQMGYEIYEKIGEEFEGVEGGGAYKDIREGRYQEEFAESLFAELSKEKGADIAPYLSCEYDLMHRAYRITLLLPDSLCSKENYYL